MKTQKIVKAEQLSAELTNRGIKNHFSISTTDYGTSCYFTFYKNSDSLDKYVIRISDHSATNMSRILNEKHLTANNMDVVKTANSVELYLFPEKFKFIENSQVFTHIVHGVKGSFVRL